MKKAKWFSGIFFALMVLAVACGGPAPTAEAMPTAAPTVTLVPTPHPTSTPVPVPTDTPTPTMVPTPAVPSSPIIFVMHDDYALGRDITIKIRNNGTNKYAYSEYYPACQNLSFHDESLKVRRIESFGEIKELPEGEFIIPQGTHCDLANQLELLPGEEAILLIWDQQECVTDNWGCAESIPLPAGSYSIVGTFYEKPVTVGPAANPFERGDPITIKWSFKINP